MSARAFRAPGEKAPDKSPKMPVFRGANDPPMKKPPRRASGPYYQQGGAGQHSGLTRRTSAEEAKEFAQQLKDQGAHDIVVKGRDPLDIWIF